jgi:Na+/proline symporter
MSNKLLVASIAALAINVGCLYFAASTKDFYWFFAMFAIIATGLITFFGILMQDLDAENSRGISDRSMRLAIAGLISSTYVTLLVYIVFIPANTVLAKIAEDLVTNFTTVVGSVIAFYFGSTAYIEGQRAIKNSESDKKA